MTVEGYFDGTTVRTLEPVDLKPNQRVFISVLDNDYSDSKKQRIQEKLDIIHSVYGMLSPEESKNVDESIRSGIKIGEVEV